MSNVKDRIVAAIEKQQHDPVGTPVMDAIIETVIDIVKTGITAHEEKYHSSKGKIVKEKDIKNFTD